MWLRKPGKYSPCFPFHILSCLCQLSPDLLYFIHVPSILNISSVSFSCFLPKNLKNWSFCLAGQNSQPSLPHHHLHHQFSIFSLNQNHLESLLTRFLGTTMSSDSVTWDACVVLCCFSCVQLCVTLWTVAFQAPVSMGFCRVPCPPPGDLPDPEINPQLTAPALAGRFFNNSATWEAPIIRVQGVQLRTTDLHYMSNLKYNFSQEVLLAPKV